MLLLQNRSHEERISLAEEIVKKLLKQKDEDIAAIGLYGSVSRRLDHPLSDLDILVVTKGSVDNKVVSSIFDGIKYGITYESKQTLLQNISNIENIYWPLSIAGSLTAKPLYDPKGVFDQFKDRYNKVIQQDFTPFMKKLFIEGIYETLCKFLTLASLNDPASVRFYAYHYLFDELICFIAILNKRYYTVASTRAQESILMPINFESYKRFAKLLLEGNVSDTNTLVEEAIEVFAELDRYLENLGININTDKLVI